MAHTAQLSDPAVSHVARSSGAVFAGLVTVVVLSTATDAVLHAAEPLFVLALGYRLLYTVLGGFVTARLAPHKPQKHGLILGVIGFFLGLAGLLATMGRGPEFGPLWYPVALVVTAVPCCWAGAKLSSMR